MQLGCQYWPGKDRNMPGACWLESLANLWVPGAARDTVSKIKKQQCRCWPLASTSSQTHMWTHTHKTYEVWSGQTWDTLECRVTRAGARPQRKDTIRTSGCLPLHIDWWVNLRSKRRKSPPKILLTSWPLNCFYQERLISPINLGFLN